PSLRESMLSESGFLAPAASNMGNPQIARVETGINNSLTLRLLLRRDGGGRSIPLCFFNSVRIENQGLGFVVFSLCWELPSVEPKIDSASIADSNGNFTMGSDAGFSGSSKGLVHHEHPIGSVR